MGSQGCSFYLRKTITEDLKKILKFLKKYLTNVKFASIVLSVAARKRSKRSQEGNDLGESTKVPGNRKPEGRRARKSDEQESAAEYQKKS